MIKFFEKTLENKIQVVGEQHPYGNAVAIGFALNFGSRDEWTKEEEGIAHLIEHMVFRSTQKYNSFDLVNRLEEKGGDLNAFTCKEFTCVHYYGLKEDLERAIDVLSQICFYSNASDKDLQSEKEVILQEILMSYDNPEDYMFDHFTSKYFAGSSLAHPIFGDSESLDKISFQKVQDFLKQYYQPANTIVSVAGNFDWDNLLDYLDKYSPQKSQVEMKERNYPKVESKKFIHFEEKNIQQIQVLFAFPVNAIQDGIHYPISILSNYLSGGMNSLLFQELREKKALCYSVGASYGPSHQAGMFSLNSSTTEDKLVELVRETRNILFDIQKNSITLEALEKVKMQIRCGLLLGESDVDARMHSLLYDKIFSRDYRSINTVVDDLTKVGEKEMKNYIDHYFKPENSSYYFMGKSLEHWKEPVLDLLN